MLEMLIIEKIQPIVLGVIEHLIKTPNLHPRKETTIELVAKDFFILKEIEKISNNDNIYVNIYGYYINEYEEYYYKKYNESFRELTRYVKSKHPFRDSFGPNRLTNYDVISNHSSYIQYLSFYSNSTKLSNQMTEKEYYEISNNNFIYEHLIDLYKFSKECIKFFKNNIIK